MKVGRRRGLMIAGGIVLVIIIAGWVAALLFDVNSYKLRIETGLSEATGLDIRINGKMGLSLFPLGLSATNIHVTDGGGDIHSLEGLKVGAKTMPLLKGRLEVTRCVLVKPVVTIVKDGEGKYNFERKLTEGPRVVFSMKNLDLSEGVLSYLDEKTGVKTELKGINLALTNVSVAGLSGEIIKNVSFIGNMDCKEVFQKDLRITNLKGPVKADKGLYSLGSLTMDIVGGKGEVNMTADESEADARYEINLSVSKLDFEKLETFFGTTKMVGGRGDLSASLTVKEKGRRVLLSNLNGRFALRGDNLVSYSMDLDKALSKYEATQKFHLVDLGAYFIIGPLGAVALKGYRYGALYYQAHGGHGTITQFISHWKIRNGVADAADCALATHHNRVALKGKLNLVSERYENVVVALLDDRGCPRITQGISGSFDNPSVGTVSAVESLAGPFFDLYRRAKRVVQAGKCQVFYSGSVQQPR
jgi:uncharacterized protein YhdP